MSTVLSSESARLLAKTGFAPITSLGSGVIAERWLMQVMSDDFCAGTYELAIGGNSSFDESEYAVAEIAVNPTDHQCLALSNSAAIRHLSHPNIVQIVRAGPLVEDRVWGCVMNCVPSDQNLLLGGSTLSDDEILQMIWDISAILSHLHERGIVHGCIGPASVLKSGTKFLLNDFWFARTIDGGALNPECGDVSWSLPASMRGFVAPEIDADHCSALRESDIYSLGALAYWLLIGRTPYSSRSKPDYSHAPPSMVRLRPQLDRRIALLIDGMLDCDPEQRPVAPLIESLVGGQIFSTV